MHRRQFIAGSGSFALLSNAISLLNSDTVMGTQADPREQQKVRPTIHPTGGAAGTDEAEWLDDLQQRCYRFFIEAADPQTGLVSDRGARDGSTFSGHASSAACGFALAAHAVASQSAWGSPGSASAHVDHMLTSLLELVQHEHGFVYHFFDRRSGDRFENCEASSIDTALLIAGAMTAAQAFADNANIAVKADQLYRRVDWRWMLGKNGLLHMGWSPEEGHLTHQWDRYSELMLLLLLAIGAPESPIPADCWQRWDRSDVLHHEGEPFLSYPPLFVHQYAHAFFDFRLWTSPSGRCYFRNAQLAHLAQIRFQKQLAQADPLRFGHYGDDLWGLTSSDSESGYRDWGGPYGPGPAQPDRGIDGTVVPSAAAGGLAIVPEQAARTLQVQQNLLLPEYRRGGDIYGRYGFVNAFNPATGWISPDVIGIDTGISLLMAANLHSGLVWDAFMRHDAARRGLRLAGFQSSR